MKIHDLIQGTPEWHAYRAQHFNASDAPAMMGCSPYKTRAQLLHEIATGIAPEVDAATQRRFDDGHRFEALARPLAEKIIGDDLYPVTGSEWHLSASFDGITLGEDVVFEHKTLNNELRECIQNEDESGSELPLHYRVQMEQQLMVAGAGSVLFMATKWGSDNLSVIEAKHCWYTSDPALRAQIVAGWAQFEKDLATYVPPASAEPVTTGRAPESLPALRIEVTGMVTSSNLAEFKATALAAIGSVNRDLSTDQDFADAEKAVKWCSDVEDRLAAAKQHALSQTASIDELFCTMDEISAEARRVRLDLDKLVKARKTDVKDAAVTAARKALDAHIADLNGELAPLRLLPVPADFAGAIKGLRSIASMQDALDTTLANGKIAADAQAKLIRANVAVLKDKAAGLEMLFADLGQVVHKAPDDFALLVQARVDAHHAAEAKRLEAERERIRAEETANAQCEAERAAAEKSEHERLAAEAIAKAAAPAPAPMEQAPVQAACVDEPATMKLGVICERLGLTVTAAFLADVLHVPHRAMLYRESDWPLICRNLVSHVGAVADMY